MSVNGFANAALQLGLQSIAISSLQRGIYNIIQFDGKPLPDIYAQATLEELHNDSLQVTEHPVETGAPIADHAFVRPAKLRLTLMWSNSPNGPQGLLSAGLGAATALSKGVNTVVGAVNAVSAASGFTSNQQGFNVQSVYNTYLQLLKMFQARSLFSVTTGKRYYKNMICTSLHTNTDWKSANDLKIILECQEVFLVATSITPLPANQQAKPGDTASIVDNGTKSLVPTSKVGAIAQ